MITDGLWKRELKHFIKEIKCWRRAQLLLPIAEKYIVHQLSKSLLYSACIMRKMLEDENDVVTDLKNTSVPMPELNLLQYKVPIIAYPFIGDKNLITEQVWASDYDNEKIKREELCINMLCNQIIHSRVWTPVHVKNKRDIYGFMFSSDKEKDKYGYLLKFEDWINAIDFFIDSGHI